MKARVGLTTLVRRTAAAIALAWRSGPVVVLAYLGTTVVVGVLPTVVALLTKVLFDDLSTPGHRRLTSAPLHVALLVAAVGVLTAVVPNVTRYAQNQLQRQLGVYVQDRLFTAVNRFTGLARFEDPQFLNRLRMAQQAGASAPYQISSDAFQIFQSAITAGGLLAALWAVNAWMAAAIVAAAVPAVITQLAAGRRRADMLWATTGPSRRQVSYGMLMLDQHAAQEVRIYGLGDFLRHRMLGELRRATTAAREVDARVLRSQAPLAAVGAVLAGAGLAWAVYQAATGVISLGTVSMFLSAMAGVQSALGSIAYNTSDVYTSTLTFGHFLDVVNAPSDLVLPERPRELGPLDRAIRLSDVWFRYSDDGPWILRGIDLEIPRGGTLAIVGANGAGKTTLVKLLCRFYDPTKGGITWDGVDIREFAPTDLRDRISVVLQDYMEYDLTVAENIGVGDLKRLDDRERVRIAAKQAEIHDKISSLPHDYDTLLSRIFFAGSDPNDPSTGVRLSGGQWQRVALARALMRADRDFLILDEPTARLDADAEQAVNERLREYRGDATSVLISHRLASIRHADTIVVLEAGSVVERGNHAQLMARNGLYARLFRLQAAGYEDGEWA